MGGNVYKTWKDGPPVDRMVEELKTPEEIWEHNRMVARKLKEWFEEANRETDRLRMLDDEQRYAVVQGGPPAVPAVPAAPDAAFDDTADVLVSDSDDSE